MKTRILFYILILSYIFSSCAKNFDDVYKNNNTPSGNSGHSTPGVVISFSPASTKNYVGSPSIVILPDGKYVASHDAVGPTTMIYLSNDKGASWSKIKEIPNMQWANLFLHKGALYLMGVERSFGAIHIRKSTDEGLTWTNPSNSTNGILFTDGQFHTAPVPVVIHDGRIWRAFEDAIGNPEDRNFQAFVISADENSDLLNASNWQATNRIPHDKSWGGSEWIEGNMVVTPGNKLVNIMRYYHDSGERAAMIHINDQASISFNPNTDFITFPGGSVKFTIRYDATSKKYWSLTNYIPDEYKNSNKTPDGIRNTLALISSGDLIHWTVNKIILQDPDVIYTGFQYVDWQIEGDDIIASIRTAYWEPDGTKANNFHDANYILFYRITNFRSTTDTGDPELNFDDMDIQVVGDENASFVISSFANGINLFTDRDYKLENVPEELSAYSFLSSKANVIDKGIIIPSRDGYVYIVAQKRTDNKLEGWILEPNIEHNYDDYNKTKLYIFKKGVTAGEQVVIPELDGFPGASPLAKKITYSVGEIPEPQPEVDNMSISVAGESGATFQLKEFKNGVTIFTNRDFVLENVPEKFKDFKFLSSDGNVIDKGSIKPSKDGYIYIIAENRTDLSDWTKEANIEFNYSDWNKTKLYIYKKQVSANEDIAIPNLAGFPGASPLAKEINYTAK